LRNAKKSTDVFSSIHKAGEFRERFSSLFTATNALKAAQ
jgi:hypothetical protein